MKLYYSPNLNPRVAVAVARFLKSPVEYIFAAPRDPRNEDAFRPINPNTLVPVLVEGERRLWETDAIACRLSEVAQSDFWVTGKLLPEFMMWLSWGTHHFTRAGDMFYFQNIIRPRYSLGPEDTHGLANALSDFHRFAPVLDDVLAGRKWLLDERLTYADFRVATALPFASEARIPIGKYKNILNWHERLLAVDAWRAPFEGLQQP
jgi:glutathione S-transferase